MKQSALIPVLVLTAGVAFGLGWIAKPSGENGKENANLNPESGAKSASSSSRLPRPTGSGASRSNGSGKV